MQTYGLFDAFARASNPLRLINARHEQTTAYMALGYACATGRPPAYAVVPGPGVLNTGAALATAWGVNAPVLCLTGQVPSMMIGRGRGQLHELPDQLATLRSLLKWVGNASSDPSQASHLTARAFQEMLSGRPGPVALEVPWDQFTASAEITPQEPLPLHPKPQPDPERIAALGRSRCWTRPRRRCCGSEAAPSTPQREIRALAAHINAPRQSHFAAARGIIHDRSPLSMTLASAQNLWPKTDLLVAFGTRLEVPTSRWGALPAGLKIARIDIDPVNEMRRLKADVPIVADSADAARALAAVAEPAQRPRPRRGHCAGQGGRRTGNPERAAADVVPGRDPRRAARERHLLRRDDPGRLRLLVRPADIRAAHADHLGLLRHARRRLPHRARRQGRDARSPRRRGDRRRRLPCSAALNSPPPCSSASIW